MGRLARRQVPYVDDFYIVHSDKSFLNSLIPVVRSFLVKELGLTLHPRKIILQHYEKGVRFIGAYLMPNRIYIDRRTKGNFYALIPFSGSYIFNFVNRCNDKLNNLSYLCSNFKNR